LLVIAVEYRRWAATSPQCLRLWLHVRNATRLSAWEEREMALHPHSGAFIGVVTTAAHGDTFEFNFRDGTGECDDNGGENYRIVALPDPADGWEMVPFVRGEPGEADIVIGSTPPSATAPSPASPTSRFIVAFSRSLFSRVFRVNKH